MIWKRLTCIGCLVGLASISSCVRYSRGAMQGLTSVCQQSNLIDALQEIKNQEGNLDCFTERQKEMLEAASRGSMDGGGAGGAIHSCCAVCTNPRLFTLCSRGTYRQGYLDVQMSDVRTSGRPDVRTSGRLDVWTSGRPGVQTSGSPDVRMSGPLDVRTSGRRDVRTSRHEVVDLFQNPREHAKRRVDA